LNQFRIFRLEYGGDLFSLGGNVLNNACRMNRRRVGVLRIAAIVCGFACLIHFAHRECARTAEMFPETKPGVFGSDVTQPALSSGSSEDFHATAYCLTGLTKAGVPAARGYVSADPKVIPLGSVIYIESPLMSGVYQVMDTGELIKGKIVDIFLPSYDACLEFGRRMVKVKVLRYGFQDNPPGK
jgi:3D (Asp-Asp-Asp) domain-containing protein